MLQKKPNINHADLDETGLDDLEEEDEMGGEKEYDEEDY